MQADGFNGGVRRREEAAIEFPRGESVAEFRPVGGVSLTVNVEQQSAATNRRLRGIDEGSEVAVGVYRLLHVTKTLSINQLWRLDEHSVVLPEDITLQNRIINAFADIINIKYMINIIDLIYKYNEFRDTYNSETNYDKIEHTLEKKKRNSTTTILFLKLSSAVLMAL